MNKANKLLQVISETAWDIATSGMSAGTEEKDWIVMGGCGEQHQSFPVQRAELLCAVSGPALPSWTQMKAASITGEMNTILQT